jgi:hypothetical protein
MSAQCFCYECAGAIVNRKTFTRHGRVDKPPVPLPDLNHAMVSVGGSRGDEKDHEDDTDDEMAELVYSDSDDDDDDYDFLDSENDDTGEEDDDPGIGVGKLTKKEVCVRVCECVSV